MLQYGLTVINNSGMSASACVYQISPSLYGAWPLAWLVQPAPAGGKTGFNWSTDYSFVSAQTGTLVPGLIFRASQMYAASLQASNQVTFTANNGQPMFTNQTAGSPSGSLIILQDSSIPINQWSVGYGMSNSPMLAIQAMPNVKQLFTPPAQYWLGFGSFQKGQVLNPTSVPYAVQLIYPANVYSLTATLNSNGTWTIQ